jgi:hypothetical protein
MLARGRQRRGFKLSDEDVLAIRSELARGERQAVLAERFGVRDTQISRIATGERHRWAIDPNEWNLAKMRALLSDIEWAGWSEVDGEYCVACERARPAGHAPNCRIAAALASGAGIPKARRN